jgi:uncharacterized coiled-coil protein SlyX
METLKQPAMIISTINAVAWVGSCAYFYKKTSSLEEELQSMNKKLQTYVKVVEEKVKNDKTPQIEESFRTVNTNITKQDKKIKKLETANAQLIAEVESLRETLDAVVNHMKSMGEKIDIKAPKKTKKMPGFVRPSKVEFTKTSSSDDESSSDEEVKKPKKPKKTKKDEESSDDDDDEDVSAIIERHKANRNK